LLNMRNIAQQKQQPESNNELQHFKKDSQQFSSSLLFSSLLFSNIGVSEVILFSDILVWFINNYKHLNYSKSCG